MARLASFDSIISWYGANRPEFRQLVSHLPFQFLPALPSGPGHAVEFYLNQARSLGAKPASRFPTIRCPETPRSFAVIQPFASSPAKRAPMEVFQRISSRLAETMPVHWLAGPDEELAGAVRMENLYELACRLRQARIFVGNDSGISHLAAAVGTPVLALFRASDPRLWAPRGPAVDIVSL